MYAPQLRTADSIYIPTLATLSEKRDATHTGIIARFPQRCRAIREAGQWSSCSSAGRMLHISFDITTVTCINRAFPRERLRCRYRGPPRRRGSWGAVNKAPQLCVQRMVRSWDAAALLLQRPACPPRIVLSGVVPHAIQSARREACA